MGNEIIPMSLNFYTVIIGKCIAFGDLTSLNGTGKYSASSPTRFVTVADVNGGSPTYSKYVIEYINIATQGDSVDFGDFINFGRRSFQILICLTVTEV